MSKVLLNDILFLSQTSQSCVSAFSSASSPDAPLLVYPSLPSASVRERVGDGPEVPRVKRMTAHPSFRLTEGDGGSVGDLALAKVEEADMADAGKGLAPVCLPSVSVGKRSHELCEGFSCCFVNCRSERGPWRAGTTSTSTGRATCLRPTRSPTWRCPRCSPGKRGSARRSSKTVRLEGAGNDSY